MSRQSYGKMYGTEPRYNDLRYKDIPHITMNSLGTKRKIFPDIAIFSVHCHNLSKTLNLLQEHYSNGVISNVSLR